MTHRRRPTAAFRFNLIKSRLLVDVRLEYAKERVGMFTRTIEPSHSERE